MNHMLIPREKETVCNLFLRRLIGNYWTGTNKTAYLFLSLLIFTSSEIAGWETKTYLQSQRSEIIIIVKKLKSRFYFCQLQDSRLFFKTLQAGASVPSGCLWVVSEWTEVTRGVETNPPLMCLNATELGKNRVKLMDV